MKSAVVRKMADFFYKNNYYFICYQGHFADQTLQNHKKRNFFLK